MTERSLASTVVLPRVWSILFMSVWEFKILGAVVRGVSWTFREKFLWFGSYRILLGPLSKNALANRITSSTLRFTTVSIAAKKASWTPFLTVTISQPVSRCTLSLLFSSSISMLVFSIVQLIDVEWASETVKSVGDTASLSFWVSRSPLHMTKSLTVSSICLRSFLFCCLFLRVKTKIVSTNEVISNVETLLLTV